MQTWILGKDSITQKIENSPMFASVFAKYCKEVQERQVDGARIRDLRAKKHRFASYTKPLGRSVLFMDAVISTAIWISVKRKGLPEAAAAEQFLTDLSEPKLLMLAMCADCADECIGITRLLDTEDTDNALVCYELEVFLKRLYFLFVEARPLYITSVLEAESLLLRRPLSRKSTRLH